MLDLKIGNKNYKIEYTIEASLCSECTEKVTNLMTGVVTAGENKAIKEFISSIADIPQTTLSMFYAGLLEHHGEDGDETVKSKSDAKKLIKQYITEHSEDETGSFYGVMGILIEQMGNDGFFNLIGLEHMMQQIQAEEQKQKEPKKPQDHKKKTTKATDK